MILRQVIYILSALIILVSCKSHKENDLALANAYDNTLYLSQVKHYMPSHLSERDSLDFVEKFTDRWVKQQVLINAIDNDDKIDMLEIEEKIENQKNQLIVTEYQKHLIKHQLDTIVSDQELRKFYNNNKNIFKLKHTIVKASFIQSPKEARHLNKINALLAKNDSTSVVALKTYCTEFADTYLSTDSNWVNFSVFVKGTPFQGIDTDKFATVIKRTFRPDVDSYFFLKVNEALLQGEIAPFEYYKYNIRNKIVTDRKASLFDQAQKILMKDALKKEEIKLYVK